VVKRSYPSVKRSSPLVKRSYPSVKRSYPMIKSRRLVKKKLLSKKYRVNQILNKMEQKGGYSQDINNLLEIIKNKTVLSSYTISEDNIISIFKDLEIIGSGIAGVICRIRSDPNRCVKIQVIKHELINNNKLTESDLYRFSDNYSNQVLIKEQGISEALVLSRIVSPLIPAKAYNFGYFHVSNDFLSRLNSIQDSDRDNVKRLLYNFEFNREYSMNDNNWISIVEMDYITNMSSFNRFIERTTKEVMIEKIIAFLEDLKILKERYDFVHGDLNRYNIFYKVNEQDGKLMFIDFGMSFFTIDEIHFYSYNTIQRTIRYNLKNEGDSYETAFKKSKDYDYLASLDLDKLMNEVRNLDLCKIFNNYFISQKLGLLEEKYETNPTIRKIRGGCKSEKMEGGVMRVRVFCKSPEDLSVDEIIELLRSLN
jgi:hypothetical protein